MFPTIPCQYCADLIQNLIELFVSFSQLLIKHFYYGKAPQRNTISIILIKNFSRLGCKANFTKKKVYRTFYLCFYDNFTLVQQVFRLFNAETSENCIKSKFYFRVSRFPRMIERRERATFCEPVTTINQQYPKNSKLKTLKKIFYKFLYL